MGLEGGRVQVRSIADEGAKKTGEEDHASFQGEGCQSAEGVRSTGEDTGNLIQDIQDIAEEKRNPDEILWAIIVGEKSKGVPRVIQGSGGMMGGEVESIIIDKTTVEKDGDKVQEVVKTSVSRTGVE